MFPIVLAHGIARFDILTQIIRDKLKLPDSDLDDRQFQYFKGIKTYLEAHGFGPVFHPNTDFAGPVDLRAKQLKQRVSEAILQTGAGKVHIIAHSMGGLDARRMIVDLDMADKVASLTTIGTPHLGTILAEDVISHGGNFLIFFFGEVINLDLDGFKDLTPAACKQFNDHAEDSEAKNGVRYQVYSSSEEPKRMFTPISKSGRSILKKDGKNDGLVPLNSQSWKPELIALDGTRKTVIQREFPIAADHLNQVGWWDFKELTLLNGINLFQQKKDYENKIKDIYLDIAGDLQQIQA